MDFSWNDYTVIQDGIVESIKRDKKMRAVTATTSAFLAWNYGLGGDDSFQSLAKDLGLYDEKYAKDTTDKISKQQKIEKNLRRSEQVMKDTFGGN